MDHYDTGAWILYRNNQIDADQRRLMDNHLAVCDICLQRYLDAAKEHEIRLAEMLLPPDFSATIEEGIRAKRRQADKKRRSRSLVNYTVAAAITLALMSSGMFDLLAREIPGLLAETGQISRALGESARWDPGHFLDSARNRLEKLRETRGE